MFRDGSSYIIEKLTNTKMMKEKMKIKRREIKILEKQLNNTLSSIKGNRFLDYFYTNIPLMENSVKSLFSWNVLHSNIGCELSYKLLPDFDGILYGIDLSKFKANDFYVDFTDAESVVFKRNLGRYCIRCMTDKFRFDNVIDDFNMCNDDIERGMYCDDVLQKSGFNISYIRQVYPNVLDFFLDACIPNEFVKRDGSSIYLENGGDYYYSSKYNYFSGPYGTDMANKVLSSFQDSLRSNFNGAEIKEGYFQYFDDRKFLPWVIALLHNPYSSDMDFDGMYYLTLDDAKYYTSLKRLNGKGKYNALGFIGPDGRFDKRFYDPFSWISFIFKGVSYLS